MKMNLKYMQIYLLAALLLVFTVVSAQNRPLERTTTMESTVTDENNNPLEGAVVYGNEGTVFVKTDASGRFSITIPDQSDIYIEAQGFESSVFTSLDYRLNTALS